MQRIAIGYDGSERGADALALGRALAELLTLPGVAQSDAVRVAIALVYPDGPVGAGGQRTLAARQRHAADHVLDGARAAWPELSPGAFRVVQAGSPAAGLQRLAQEHDVDALVVGASHHGAPGRILPGSATEHTLHGAPCAVFVAPPGYAAAATSALRRIGVAFDDSPEARAALAVVRRIADGRADVSVALVEAAHDDPAHELIEASRTLDLLVLGSRGHGPMRRLLLGSVSTHVVRACACPLLLLPHGADAFASDAAGGAAAPPERADVGRSA